MGHFLTNGPEYKRKVCNWSETQVEFRLEPNFCSILNIYDFFKKYGEIDNLLILNTLGIHFGLIPDDIDPQTMTQDDLYYYFYDRTLEPLLGSRHTEQ